MSVATTQPDQSACLRIPVLIPLYGAHLESFSAQSDGTYWCGSGTASAFRLAFSGVAANHCSFTRKAGTFSVNRIDGRVWVNDLPVNGTSQLNDGDVISFGPVTYRLEIQDAPQNLSESEDQPLNTFMSTETVVEPLSFDPISASSPVTAGSESPEIQNTVIQTTLQDELEEQQRLLALRQQQLGELTQIVRARERDADLRLVAIEDRSSHLTAQWNELARQQERLAQQEREIALRSLETDRQCHALTDQRQLADAAAQNSRMFAAVEQAQQEHLRQEAELRPLQQSIESRHLALQEWQSELDSRANEIAARLLALKSLRRAQSKDLLCERNALSQLRQNLDSREIAISEREVLVARQLEDVRSQVDVFDLPAPLLKQYESSETRSKELDLRTELLDRRDEELRERARRIEQTEGEIESQRRQLLEARQQLELARAEIQVAMRKQPEPEQPAASPLPVPLFGRSFVLEPKSDHLTTHPADLISDPLHSESDDPAYVPATDLRSELAGLFGLRKPAAESVAPLPLAAFVDVSEPSGENLSVMFHFDSDAAQLAATESKLTVDSGAEPDRADNSDDVVRDYMEQLLSRNRKSAGHALPGELKAFEKKKAPEAALPMAKGSGGPSPKSPPKVKSYIEQYMTGNMANSGHGEPWTMSEPDREVPDVPVSNELRPVQPRPKMDLLKLKENMDSFRTLSTLSVENALASHAIKVERLGFSGRTVFTALLIFSTLLLGIVNASGAIDAPMLVWVTFICSIAMLTELLRKYVAITARTRKSPETLSATE